jgi:hypothetical protein
MMLSLGGGVGVPLGVPPLPQDALLTKVAPEECLVYFSSAGMAKPEASSTNQTEQLFAEPEIQELAAQAEKMIRAAVKESARKEGREAQVFAEEGPTLVKALLTRPFAIYLAELKVAPKSPPQIRGGAVLSLGDDADKLTAALDRCLAALPKDQIKDVTVDGTTFHRVTPPDDGPELTWGVKGKYLYVAAGKGEAEALLKRAQDGAAPKWLTALHKQLPLERVSTVTTMDVKALIDVLAPLGGPEVPKVLEATGISGIERLSGVSGLDKEGFVSRSLVQIKGEPKGFLALANQKGLTAADLDLVPRDATFAAAWKLDAEKARTTILATVENIDPKAAKEYERMPAEQRQLLDEVLKALGDTWCVFDSPGEGGMFTGVTAVVSIKDADAAASVQKKLLRMAEAAAERTPDPQRRPRFETVTFGRQTIHVFDARDKNFPLAPSWCLTDKHLIVALYPEAIKGFLTRGKNFESLAKVPEVGAALEGGGQTLTLTYTDTRRIFDLAYPFAPVVAHMLATEMRMGGVEVPSALLPSARSIRRHLRPSVSMVRRTDAGFEVVSHQTIPGSMGLHTLPIAAGLLIPAVRKVQDAGARTQSSGNLHQIALAIHNYADTNNRLPPAYRAGKDGKPLLSWRVLILPYIEQDNLYKEFRLDEPWDSDHNKKLIDKMPKTYRSPGSAAAPGMTNYLTVRGATTMFPGAKGVRFADVTDGLSNTIMVVEASDRKAVPWTKPDDFELNEKNPADGLVGLWPAGFLAALGDGSVRFISNTISPKVLKDLFIRNDGNVIPEIP